MYKTCCRCNRELLTSSFRKDGTRVDGFQSSCKECARLYHKSRYTEKYGDKSAARSRQIRADNAVKLVEYKTVRGCQVCGERASCCLEFHHLDPTAKEYGIAGSTTRSWISLLTEIQKCVVLCSNCHKKYHAGLIELA